jgi:hypothetical protein
LSWLLTLLTLLYSTLLYSTLCSLRSLRYALAALHHDAGNSDAATRTLQEFIFSSPPDPQPLPQQKLQPFQFQAGGKTPLRVATVATSPRAELDDLIHTGLKAGVEVDVLGLGMEWGGTHTKMELYYECVRGANNRRAPTLTCPPPD